MNPSRIQQYLDNNPQYLDCKALTIPIEAWGPDFEPITLIGSTAN